MMDFGRSWNRSALLLGAVVAAGMSGGGVAYRQSAQIARGLAKAAPRPNIVFVLTDDLAWNLVTRRYMPHLVALEREGVTFTNYIVSDSLCCPSRSSIFTGLFPHNTHVFKNEGELGGYRVFRDRGLEDRTYAVAVRRAGYLTSFMGKYLNGYGVPRMTRYIPPGWTDWHTAGNAYREFDYDLNENGRVDHFGGAPPPASNATNYLTDVLDTRAQAFVNRAANARQPFVMEVATFAPHKPYIPAPRNAGDFLRVRAPRDPSFNANNVDPPRWLGSRAPLTVLQLALIDYDFRLRAQSVEAVDRLLGDVEATLKARGLAQNTYIVFSSDNGYHMGQHRLLPGKQSAFESDIRVPLVIAGPGIPHNRSVPELAQNIDLYPTFTQLAGATPTEPVDGRSLLPLLRAPPTRPVVWRAVALIEHRGKTTSGDPDIDYGRLSGNPTSYEAIRLDHAVYVEYSSGEREYYDIGKDPYERGNVYSRLGAATKAGLHETLQRLRRCHGTGNASCWTAAQPRSFTARESSPIASAS